MDFSHSGKPTDNPLIESFNGSFRDECPAPIGSCHWAMRTRIESWRQDYNYFRTRSAIGDVPLAKYVTQF
jgi:putative transposase